MDGGTWLVDERFGLVLQTKVSGLRGMYDFVCLAPQVPVDWSLEVCTRSWLIGWIPSVDCDDESDIEQHLHTSNSRGHSTRVMPLIQAHVVSSILTEGMGVFAHRVRSE